MVSASVGRRHIGTYCLDQAVADHHRGLGQHLAGSVTTRASRMAKTVGRKRAGRCANRAMTTSNGTLRLRHSGERTHGVIVLSIAK